MLQYHDLKTLLRPRVFSVLTLLSLALPIGATDFPPPGVLRTLEVPSGQWTHLPFAFAPSAAGARSAFTDQGSTHTYRVVYWDNLTQTWLAATHTPGTGWSGDKIPLDLTSTLLISRLAPQEPGDLRFTLGGLLPAADLQQNLTYGLNHLSSPQLSPQPLSSWTWTLPPASPVTGTLYSPRNETLAALSTSPQGRPIWTAPTGQSLPELQPIYGYFFYLTSPDPVTIIGTVESGYTASKLPAIRAVEVETAPNQVVLTIETPAGTSHEIDLFYQDVTLPDGDKTPWQLQAQGLVTGTGTEHELTFSLPASAPDVRLYQISDSLQDADADGLSDGMEALVTGTNPKNADTDGDGLTDSAEYAQGTDPTNTDTDGDGMTDGDEIAQGHDPLQADNPAVQFCVFTPLR